MPGARHMTGRRPRRAAAAGRWLLLIFVLPALAGCDVPKPPVEQLTPVVGAVTRTPQLDPNAPTPTPVPMTLPPTGHLWFLQDGHVWTCAPDGSGAQQAAADPATSPPAPAPDGRQVAFFSARKLVLLDVTAGRTRTLAEDDMAPLQRPAWSPDGRLLAYFTEDATHYGDEIVWTVPAAGGAPQRLTVIHTRGYLRGPTFERVVRWAPDGRRVAVGAAQGPISVLPLDPSAGDPKTVNGGEPSWSTDSRNLLFAETLNGSVALYDIVSDDFQPYRNEHRRDGTRLGDNAQGPLPRFNTDASLILYRAEADAGGPAVAVRGRDGSEQLFLPGNNPAWAPDGQWIVYETGVVTTTATGPAWQPQGLARIRADGSGQDTVRSTPGAWPAWAP